VLRVKICRVNRGTRTFLHANALTPGKSFTGQVPYEDFTFPVTEAVSIGRRNIKLEVYLQES
jgi:hypothetical protein